MRPFAKLAPKDGQRSRKIVAMDYGRGLRLRVAAARNHCVLYVAGPEKTWKIGWDSLGGDWPDALAWNDEPWIRTLGERL
jgi:hypothetical protein